MVNSLETLSQQLDDKTVVFHGHDYGGASTTIGQEKVTGLLGPMMIRNLRYKAQHGC